LAGYRGKINESYPEFIEEIIWKLVNSDPNERSDYNVIA